MKGSDNNFPKVLLDMQTSDPSAPSDEDWKLYAKPGGIYARSSNAIVGPFAAGTVPSAGSNSTDVAGITAIGGTSTFAPAAHWHKGVAAVTSSASNTLQRPTVNLRAGTGIALTATDTDGSGELDTVTVHATGAAAGGGSGSGWTVAGTGDLTAAFTTASTTFTDLTGVSVTKTTAARRCIVHFVGNVSNNNAGSWTAVTLVIDGTNQGTTTLGLAAATSGAANDIYNVSFTYVTAVLSAASHTFKIQMRVSGGTGKIREEGEYSLTVLETDIAA